MVSSIFFYTNNKRNTIFSLESSHLAQQLEEANSAKRELDDAFRQIKANEKQIKTLQQEREELNKVKSRDRLLKAFLNSQSCLICILKSFILNCTNI